MAGAQARASMASLVRLYYPQYASDTHCVPPLHFSRVAYGVGSVPGAGRVLTVGAAHAHGQTHAPFNLHRGDWAPEAEVTLARVQDSDVQDDQAVQLVLHNLDTLGRRRGEAMFLVSGLDYGPSRWGLPAWAPATQHLGPNLPTEQGDFDVLLIHKEYGLTVLEVKAVGSYHRSQGVPVPPAVLARKVDQALTQLEKNARVAQRLLQDVAPGLAVKKVLALPNVDSAQLLAVLTGDPGLAQVGGAYHNIPLVYLNMNMNINFSCV